MLNFIGKLHDITIGFFKCLNNIIIFSYQWILTKRYPRRYESEHTFDDGCTVKFTINQRKNKAKKKISEHSRNLTLFPFVLLVFYLTYKFSLSDIIKILIA